MRPFMVFFCQRVEEEDIYMSLVSKVVTKYQEQNSLGKKYRSPNNGKSDFWSKGSNPKRSNSLNFTVTSLGLHSPIQLTVLFLFLLTVQGQFYSVLLEPGRGNLNIKVEKI